VVGTPDTSPIVNALTVDVEEHFQVSALDGVVGRHQWDSLESRVEANTERVLDLLDESGVAATFFVLGWVGERYPRLVQSIAGRGHEVGCHGFSHTLVYRQRPLEFAEEVERSKAVLEASAGCAVRGYRAASFSITRRSLWALDVLVEAGFHYDSSIYPVVHDRYGLPGGPRGICRLHTPQGHSIVEVPPATVRVGPLVLPVAGGGYLRLYPSILTRWAIRRLNRVERMPAVVYLHPWEVDPDQPRFRPSWYSRFRHYQGLHRTSARLRDLLARFRFATVSTVIGARVAVPERMVS
jgi:polysaccharide deacetylase family protein (PEP-CTERM system associated)